MTSLPVDLSSFLPSVVAEVFSVKPDALIISATFLAVATPLSSKALFNAVSAAFTLFSASFFFSGVASLGNAANSSFAAFNASWSLESVDGAITEPSLLETSSAVLTSGTSTSTVIVRTPFSVLPDTLAAFLPTNFTSSAFFTTSKYAPFAPVVLSDDTFQPIFCKSPTVAAAFLFTASFKLTKSAVVGTAGVVPAGTVPAGVVSNVVLFNTEPTPTS